MGEGEREAGTKWGAVEEWTDSGSATPATHGRRATSVRALRLVLAAATILALLGILGHAVWQARSAGPAATTPLTSPFTMPSEIAALVDGNVRSTAVAVAGQAQKGTLPLSVTLRRGRNAITFSAPPFRTLNCQITLPQINKQGDCSFSVAEGQSATYTVIFQVGPSDLDGALLEQATDTVSSALRPAELAATLPAGEYYATGLDADGRIVAARAVSPLHAHVSFAPLGETPAGHDTSCLGSPLCPGLRDPTARGPATGQVWWLDVRAALRWEYDDDLGRMVARSAVYGGASVPLALIYTASDGWHVWQASTSADLSGLIGASLCAPSYALIAQVAPPSGASTGKYLGGQGCEVELTDPSGASRGRYIFRFGVLLAGDDAAHQEAPALPQASDAVRALFGN